MEMDFSTLTKKDWRLTTFCVESDCVFCGELIEADEKHYVLTRDRKAPLFKRRLHIECQEELAAAR